MTLRKFIFVWIVLSATFSHGAWAESIWNTATEMATCRAHGQLSRFLRSYNYACRSDAPPLHKDWISQEWLAATGLSACYIGRSDHIPGLQSGYRCSVTTDRKRYHNIVCTRPFPADEVESAKSSLENWEENFSTRALELQKCEGSPIDMSFANRNLVPESLWKWYRHELGIVLSRQDSLMYMGIGIPSSCGKARTDRESTIGVVSFFLGAGGPAQPDPFFWETRRNLGDGVGVTIGGMRDLAEIQRKYNPSGSWGAIPPGLSVTMGFVRVHAEAMLQRDNLETLRGFREVDFADIFESAWLDVEKELDLKYTGKDLGDYVDIESEIYPGFQEMQCQLGGSVDIDEIFESFLTEAELFDGQGLPGCGYGEVFLVSMPMRHLFSSLEADTFFILIGENCNNIIRTQRTILGHLEETISQETVEELRAME